MSAVLAGVASLRDAVGRLRAGRLLPPWAVDAAPVLVLVTVEWARALGMACYRADPRYYFIGPAQNNVFVDTLAALTLLARRRYPVPVFAVSLLLMARTEYSSSWPALVALSTLAERSWRWTLGSAAAYLVAHSLRFWIPRSPYDLTAGPLYMSGLPGTFLFVAAAVLLGRLVRTRRELARNMAELRETQEHERELHAQAVLARERAQLAREMHDVVSHQVSLIAVGAGALQVAADSSGTREAARTIRKLSVTTLEELRHMVTLLRAPGSTDPGTTPRPTREQLAALVTGSGLDARLVGGVPESAGAAVQRAVYRIVQEALTNVRKHAPGATATVEVRETAAGLEVTVTNTAPTRPALQLPGSGLGLVGLRERAENLHGTLTCGTTPDGGYRVRATLPARETA
ncbi:sensor histidine kinase [Kitasatospora purpeofusca]|uniref:sensor histidine kinase n=1 Tax=Kitasatospora purpeofusca TaxID=67352 RepID=UPI00381E5E88